MGRTERPDRASPFATVDGRAEGIVAERCVGTYLHGALEDAVVLEELCGVRLDEVQTKREGYERLATWFEHSADNRLFEKLFL